MKRIPLITFTALLTLGAFDAHAQSADPLYQKAYQQYTARSYEDALVLFEELGKTMDENADVHFFYGRCALELQRYDEALSAFERVLILDPAHVRARIELARLYYETQRYEYALLETDSLLSSELPADARASLSAFRSKVEKKVNRATFSGNLVMGGGYESNAKNDMGEETYTLPMFPLSGPFTGRAETDDTYLYAMAALHGGYDFAERGGWSLQNTLTGYTKHNTEVEENDLNLFSLQVIPTWTQKDSKLEFPVSYERVYLNHDTYLYNLSATAKATCMIDRSSELSGGYTFRRGYYTNSTLDVASHRIFASYKRAFGADPVLISLNGGYIVNDEINTVRSDVESRIYEYGIQIAKTFPFQITGSVGYLGQSIRYSDIDPLFGTRQSDNRHSLEARMGYPLRKDLSINALVGYLDHRSNHAPYDYDKTTAVVSLIYSF